MALFPVFITFVIFNLSIRLSHGEISDKISSPTGELLRGFDTRKAPSTKQPTNEKGRAEVPRFLLDLYRKRTHLRRGRWIEQESEIVRVFLQERKYTPSGRLMTFLKDVPTGCMLHNYTLLDSH